jgi:osmotically-inducible protein OsmY
MEGVVMKRFAKIGMLSIISLSCSVIFAEDATSTSTSVTKTVVIPTTSTTNTMNSNINANTVPTTQSTTTYTTTNPTNSNMNTTAPTTQSTTTYTTTNPINPAPTTQATTTYSTTSTTVSSADEGIVTDIYAKYTKEPALIGTSLTVNSENGIVTISGNVTAQAQADAAMIAAKSIAGVKDVRSAITVTTNPDLNNPGQTPRY